MNDEFTTSTGKTFDTETGRLWYGGVVLLPSVADEYADMSYKVWMTRDTADDDFASRTTVTGTLSDVYEAYDGLRGDFQNILAQSATNLVATGGALKELAEETSENDGAAAAEIEAAAGDVDEISPEVSDPKSTEDGDPEFTDSHEKTPGQPTGI